MKTSNAISTGVISVSLGLVLFLFLKNRNKKNRNKVTWKKLPVFINLRTGHEIYSESGVYL